MSTLNGKSVASTYDQVVKRQDSYSATGNQIEIMDDSGVIKTTPLYLDSVNSRVGIGTAGPASALDVVGSSQYYESTLSTSVSADNTIQYPLAVRAITSADMLDGFGTAIMFQIEDSGADKNAGSIQVIRDGSDDIYRMVLDTRGNGDITTLSNVGIGTASPDNALHAKPSSGNMIAKFEGASSGNSAYIYAGSTTQGVSNSSGTYGWFVDSSTSIRAYTDNTERLHIDSAGDVTVSTGNLVIGTHGKGIDFSANTSDAAGMTNELLDDYEEGTWTPAFISGTSPSITIVSATYTKIGNIVNLYGYISWGADGTGSDNVQLTGLPFTVASNGYFTGTVRLRYDSFTSPTETMIVTSPSSSQVNFYNSSPTAGGSLTALNHSHIDYGNNNWMFSLMYSV